MKLKEKIDMIQFLRNIQKCSSDVWFLSDEGDRLNLKSTLSQYIFSSITNQQKMIQSGNIECADEGDYQVLGAFLK